MLLCGFLGKIYKDFEFLKYEFSPILFGKDKN